MVLGSLYSVMGLTMLAEAPFQHSEHLWQPDSRRSLWTTRKCGPAAPKGASNERTAASADESGEREMRVLVLPHPPDADDAIAPVDRHGTRLTEPAFAPDELGSVVSEPAIHVAVGLEPGKAQPPWPKGARSHDDAAARVKRD